MPRGTQNLACDGKREAPESYPESPTKQTVPPAFDRAIRILAPSGKHADICALFGYRVSYSSIKFWRYGWRPAPQWAIDALAALLHQDSVTRLELMANVQASAPAPGLGSHNNIAKWNARRFAEKKKPGV